MTVDEILKLLNEEEDKIKRRMANILLETRRNSSPGFADRMEKYMLEHDLLPRGRKAN